MIKQRIIPLLIIVFVLIPTSIFAQDDVMDAIQPQNTQLEMIVDAFGIEQQILVGELRNDGTEAYSDITLFVELYDSGDELIGEGFGYPVNACGAIIDDYPLQPNLYQAFRADLDLFELDSEISRYEFIINATPTEAETPIAIDSNAITEVATDEVVHVEWLDNNTVRYGIGCANELFTRHNWATYDVSAEEITELDAHPDAVNITGLMIQQTQINTVTQAQVQNPDLIETSFLSYPAQARRIVWQNDINSLFTAEPDGSFSRMVSSRLAIYSLQGFVWSPLGNFVAYYFGAYGEPIRYFTASSSGAIISAFIDFNRQSQTVPGLTDDGRRVIISGEFDDGRTGYAFQSVVGGGTEFMFEVPFDELPGNNYPAPAYFRKDNNTRYVYIVRDEADETILQCFFREKSELTTLTNLPLQLEVGERAWSALSPDGSKLAIGANGDHSGLWIVDLNMFDVCQ